ncbi:MAG: MCE family protein [Deltaproteobacteria bacterium]|nr:MCE family protein [Deltaproteobacteria bacterium]
MPEAMLQDRAIQVRVGILVSAGLLLAMLVIFMIGSDRAWFERKYSLYCTLPDAGGIGPGTSVSLAGMRVGSVSAVGFSPDADNKALIVQMEIASQFQDRIRRDSKASVASQGLLGDKIISLSVGSAAHEPLKHKDFIETEPSSDLLSQGASIRELMGQAEQTMQAIQKLVAAVDRGEGMLAALLHDPDGAMIVKDLASGARSFRRMAGKLEGEAGSVGLGQVMRNLESASHDIRNVTAQIRRGEGTLGALLSDNSIYQELRTMFGKAGRNLVLKSVVRDMIRENERAALGNAGSTQD